MYIFEVATQTLMMILQLLIYLVKWIPTLHCCKKRSVLWCLFITYVCMNLNLRYKPWKLFGKEGGEIEFKPLVVLSLIACKHLAQAALIRCHLILRHE